MTPKRIGRNSLYGENPYERRRPHRTPIKTRHLEHNPYERSRRLVAKDVRLGIASEEEFAAFVKRVEASRAGE